MGRPDLRQVAWRVSHQYYGETTKGRARVQRRLLARSRLGSSDAPSLRCNGILGDARTHVSGPPKVPPTFFRRPLLAAAVLESPWRAGTDSRCPPKKPVPPAIGAG